MLPGSGFGYRRVAMVSGLVQGCLGRRDAALEAYRPS